MLTRSIANDAELIELAELIEHTDLLQHAVPATEHASHGHASHAAASFVRTGEVLLTQRLGEKQRGFVVKGCFLKTDFAIEPTSSFVFDKHFQRQLAAA